MTGKDSNRVRESINYIETILLTRNCIVDFLSLPARCKDEEENGISYNIHFYGTNSNA